MAERKAKAPRSPVGRFANVQDRPRQIVHNPWLVDVAGIPRELRTIPRWLVWREDQRANGKLGKVPMSAATLNRCDVTKAVNWSTCDRAIAIYETERTVAGVGFALSDDDLVVLDLDHVRDPVTGDLKAWAAELVTTFGSYTEISPSGTGLHVWTRGDWRGLNQWDGIEVKRRKGYLTVTGVHHKGTPRTIERRQKELDALAESARHKVAKRRVTDRTFRALFGNDLAGRPTPSEGDMSFALYCFWILDGDRAAVTRAMKQSDRYREKWDARRPGGTYLSITLDKAEALYREERRQRELAEGRDPLTPLRRAGLRITSTRETVIRALAALDRPIWPRELARTTGLTEGQVKMALRRLLEYRAVVRMDTGYRASPHTCAMPPYRYSQRYSGGAIVDFEAAVARKRIESSDAEVGR